ncbi:nuclear transport factor 2 family protein [Fodinibius salsisoli]|uniref:Nuclear transport factor 2 family protein n=1 Tax=Fodinibius salsisoli TaxID=2820877 RepID=A0ABT3PHY7_9BACT|nr:nuclear transport factor 2 family protein [Fodinibius salsisoli]MCW9705546.1 nuclear transport factor 2 family protein [Fodinibius salsisoli]
MKAQNYTDEFKKAFIRKVTSDVTRYVIEKYFEAMNTGAESDTIASLFSKDVNFYSPDHDKPTNAMTDGYKKVINCVQELKIKMKSIFFNIKSMDIDGEEAVVLAKLTARQRKTGEAIYEEFSFQFTVHNGEITRFRIYKNDITRLEDKPEEQKYANISN